MPESNALAVLRAALPRALEGDPSCAPVLALRALPGIAAALPATVPIRAEQGFKPLHDALRAEGVPVVDGIAADAPANAVRASRIVVLPPRSRDEGRALMARAVRDVAPGGLVAGAALNDEGARSAEKDLATLLPLAGQISKAHGRAFWTVPRPAVLPEATQELIARWLAADEPRRDAATGLWQRPGVFNEGRLDAGSALLIEPLPKDLRIGVETPNPLGSDVHWIPVGQLCAQASEDLRSRTTGLQIGDFTLTRYDGGYWLAHKDGEGMQVRQERLQTLVDELWKEF